MSQYNSYKWISTNSVSGSGRQLQVNQDAAARVFSRLRGCDINFISVFGRARQGKSFLMNCLSGELELFRVSNEKDSCTQGIDMSDKWIDVNEFSRIDGGRGEGRGAIKVGFIDAEGQGDRNVTYDATLVCPILLVSKCVIFNWKGDLQKDHILETLGIMTKAASNVSGDTNGSSSASSSTRGGGGGGGGPKFSHLHIVFRDWQAENCDERSVFATLFEKEHTADSSMRDRIRDEVLNSFLSVRVWLFDAPSDNVADLRSRLTIDKASAEFRAQVRALRAVLSQQLSEPTYFAGQRITASTINMIVSGVADTLNAGNVVLPHSMFVNMMKLEIEKLRQQLERTLQEDFNAMSQQLQVSASTAEEEFMLTESQATESLRQQFLRHLTAFREAVDARVGDISGTDMREAIGISTTLLAAEQLSQNLLSLQLPVVYMAQFSQWLLRTRVRAEQYMEAEFAKLFANVNDVFSDSALRDQFTMISNRIRYQLGVDRYPPNALLQDAVDTVTRLFDAHCAAADRKNTENWELLALAEAEAEAERERQAMLQAISDGFDEAPPVPMVMGDVVQPPLAPPAQQARNWDDEDDWSNYTPPPRSSAAATTLSKQEQALRAAALFQNTSLPKGKGKSSSSSAATRNAVSARDQLANATLWAASNNLTIDGAPVQPLSGGASTAAGTAAGAGAGAAASAHTDILGASQQVQQAMREAQLSQLRATQESIANIGNTGKARTKK